MLEPAAITEGIGDERANSLVSADQVAKWFRVRAPDQRGRPRKGLLKAVDGVSLDIRRGETFGLVGESGSGKSTLGRLLTRLIEPSQGRIVFDGSDVTAASPRDLRHLRSRMQIVFQDPGSSLDPRMTVATIVMEGMIAAPRAERSERVRRALELVGLGSRMSSRLPSELSGGQRQRVAIARALAVEPEFIVLDEPTSALDVSVQAQVLNLLSELQATLQLSYLFISHDLALIRGMAQRVAVMYLGRIIEEGCTNTLLEDPRHPYTQALVSAVPTIAHLGGRATSVRRIVLDGEIPSPIDPPNHCRFASRCSRRISRCIEEDPSLQEDAESERRIACFNHVPYRSIRR